MPKPKRTSGEMRSQYLDRGAFLIEFKTPAAPLEMFGGVRTPPGLGPTSLLTGKDLQAVTDRYRTMERKGFRVTKDIGCLIPEEQYSTYQGGATRKGHQRSFEFFGHWCPTQDDTMRNEYGWPMGLQISHRCHRRSCARVDHLLAEERWRNLKRNYCGFNGDCDCGSVVKCLRRYQMEAQSDTPEFCTTEEEVRAVLEGAPQFVIHSPSRFENRDKAANQRKANRDNRKRSQELHSHATERKQARLTTIIETDSE